ncbi:peptidase G2 autoproteolytic cleavage domain-containing protein [Paenibacillus terrigena]|uniref:peptidase G2 autoproteolytic cleavage domain-containing protein n=1 Tax=Paenibacillus terrigena TaxID=369333 RepID=UPI001FDEC519|nr:peptidase G2 autoproteolytic cleavage domain-containing protein [Paenibacillus terrigena]
MVVPEEADRYGIPQWYIPRSQRLEWIAVGLLGKLRVRDDGTFHDNPKAEETKLKLKLKLNKGT